MGFQQITQHLFGLLPNLRGIAAHCLLKLLCPLEQSCPGRSEHIPELFNALRNLLECGFGAPKTVYGTEEPFEFLSKRRYKLLFSKLLGKTLQKLPKRGDNLSLDFGIG
ncbi:MAG: hypothetical protein PHI18_06525 [bacterium]|nr:hypothetical protein [bacterium]